MPCACGKNKKTTVYEYKSPTGGTTTYNSEVQARAKQIKSGGTYRPVTR